MLPIQHIEQQLAERQELLKEIHAIILAKDTTVTGNVEPMMGKEMIIYKAKGMMKYGLSSMKKYMSLHVLPMYMSPEIYDRYKKLLPKANFQKGCINFSIADEMPLAIVKKLIADCSKVDLVKIREDYLKNKKTPKAKK